MSAPGFVPSSASRAASEIEAPPASAASVAEARNGVEPMLPSATRPPTVATATMAQSLARRVNFSYPKPDGPVRGTRISTIISLAGSMAVSKNPVKNDVIGTSRRPSAEASTTTTSEASVAVGRSAAGSACASEPPMVPRCRTCGSPTNPAASAISGASAAKMGEEATSLCRVNAPIATCEPSTRM